MRIIFFCLLILSGLHAKGELSIQLQWKDSLLQGGQFLESQGENHRLFVRHPSWDESQVPVVGGSIFRSLHGGPLSFTGLYRIAASRYGPSISSITESTRFRLDTSAEHWRHWALGFRRTLWGVSYRQEDTHRSGALFWGPGDWTGMLCYSRNSRSPSRNSPWFEIPQIPCYEVCQGLLRFRRPSWGLTLLGAGSLSPCVPPGGLMALHEENSLGPWTNELLLSYSTPWYRNARGEPLAYPWDIQWKNRLEILDWAGVSLNTRIPENHENGLEMDYGLMLFWRDTLSSRTLFIQREDQLTRMEQGVTWKSPHGRFSLVGTWYRGDRLSLSLGINPHSPWELQTRLLHSGRTGISWSAGLKHQGEFWFFSLRVENLPDRAAMEIGRKFP